MSASVETLVAELDGLIENAITNAPRSLQKRIGPSEWGTPCDLKIGYKLLDHPEVNTARTLAWKPWLGTAAHDQMKILLETANYALPNWHVDGVSRYLVEERVTVGNVNGDDITGSCDCYLDATVFDWKFVGGTMLRKYRAEGPGQQYRVQAHSYGYGWRKRGYPVENVAVYFLPRDQEWKQRYVWHEPYDERIAVEAVSKVDGIAKLTSALGVRALPLLKKAEAFCQSCPWLDRASTDLARGCPGHPDAVSGASDSIHSLIA